MKNIYWSISWLFRPLSRLLVGRAYPQTRGTISGLPLRGRVEVLRDRWGIPHLFAENDHDLFAAQGFVHAQDRLWQMERLRRFTSGKLSEIAGEATVGADMFARMLGLPGMRCRAAAAFSEADRAIAEAYAEGVNAYLTSRGRDLPLEFRSMGFTPEPWTSEDEISFLIYLSWNLSFACLTTKLFALVKGKDLTLREWNDLFPSSPGESLPPDPYFDSLAKLRIGALHPGVLAMHRAMPEPWDAKTLVTRILAASPGAISNNWAVSRSADGKPLLANDPHLGLSLPAIWYLCHLHAPGIDAAGASVPGTPGIVIGRNTRVAWGFTTVMLDAIDVLLFRVDPADPRRYRIGDRWFPMEGEELRIQLPRGREVSVPLYRTVRGPVITAVERGIEAVAVLKWYGSLPGDQQTDRSFRVLPSFLRAAKAADIIEAGRSCSWISQNFLAADVDGHIAWSATGAAPVRDGYSGRLPGDGSAGADWKGFLPYDEMPHLFDPPEGFIVTANNKSTDERSPHPISYYWAGPYRHQRITDLLRGMKSPTPEDFRLLQADRHSLAADRVLDKVLAFDFQDPGAREAADQLRGWDRQVSARSRGAAVFEAFLVSLERALTEWKLGPEVGLYLNARAFGIVDVALDRPESPWWGNEEPRAVVERALVAAMELLGERLGRRRAGWSWGRLHRYAFRHPGATSPITRLLLNPWARPAEGDCNTVNASWYYYAGGSFDATIISSMRVVVPLGDIDGMRVIIPLGQSGQPGHPHYDDLTDAWARCELVPLPLSRGAVEKIARDRQTLEP
jgi:penicillin amidase